MPEVEMSVVKRRKLRPTQILQRVLPQLFRGVGRAAWSKGRHCTKSQKFGKLSLSF